MKKVLITGATGFVGANLARRLLMDGHQVHLIVRPGYNSWRIVNLLDKMEVYEVDLGDSSQIAVLLARTKPDWIFHLAVNGAYSSQTDLGEMIRTNFLSTVNLVECAVRQGFESFVNTGSSSEYGFKTEAPSERTWLEPNSHYAVTKAAATQFCRYTAQSRQANLNTLRLYSVFGPWEEPSRFVPTLIRCGLKGDLPPLVNPNVARDYVFVEDVIDAYLLAATAPGQELGAVYNVGTGIQTTVQEAVEVARKALPIVALPNWGSMENRIWDSSTWVADPRSIKSELQWLPKFSFEQGFRLTLDWFLSNETANMKA